MKYLKKEEKKYSKYLFNDFNLFYIFITFRKAHVVRNKCPLYFSIAMQNYYQNCIFKNSSVEINRNLTITHITILIKRIKFIKIIIVFIIVKCITKILHSKRAHLIFWCTL